MRDWLTQHLVLAVVTVGGATVEAVVFLLKEVHV